MKTATVLFFLAALLFGAHSHSAPSRSPRWTAVIVGTAMGFTCTAQGRDVAYVEAYPFDYRYIWYDYRETEVTPHEFRDPDAAVKSLRRVHPECPGIKEFMAAGEIARRQ